MISKKNSKKKIKALVLFSGGLDSLLVVKILEKQGLEVTGICFSSVFFGAEKAQKIAEVNNIKLVTKNFSEDILNLVKSPPHGLGKNMNPCVDCHAKMFQRANEFATKNGYSFLASGEVLGQRPFSQNKQALLKVSETAGLEILRPLSAKLLSETEIEKTGLVDRNKLFGIQGRQRNKQLKLAKKLGVKEFEAPAGGCLLTDPGFSLRLKKALNEFSEITFNDLELLKWGRVYWKKLKNQEKPVLVVIGRHKDDNEVLEKIFSPKTDLLFKPKDIPGPNVLIRFFEDIKDFQDQEIEIEIPKEKPELETIEIYKNKTEMLKSVLSLTGWYITKARDRKIIFTKK
jgi:tRNA U34 2-thiouridine synthase MnmA/TrmU